MPPLKARTVLREEIKREESLPAAEWGESIRQEELATGAPGEDAPVGVGTPPRLNLPNRRRRDPYVRWCGRGEAARPLPIPIRPQQSQYRMVTFSGPPEGTDTW
jgi:hypothetical protein